MKAARRAAPEVVRRRTFIVVRQVEIDGYRCKSRRRFFESVRSFCELTRSSSQVM
jgi:hypothetical protein